MKHQKSPCALNENDDNNEKTRIKKQNEDNSDENSDCGQEDVDYYEENEHIEKAKINNQSSSISFMQYLNSCDKLNVVSLLVTVIAILIMAYIGIEECKRCFNEINEIHAFNANQTISNNELSPYQSAIRERTYWVYLNKSKKDDHLKHVYKVLESMGYKNEVNSKNWNLLWAHDYPFVAQYGKLKDLKPYQKVNHFPGTGFLTTKVQLATSNLKYIPPAFKLPEHKEAFLNYTSKFPHKKFVLKHNEHRHIRIKTKEEIPLDEEGNFVQEFLDNPLLVSGHMFDIGIYTIITSIDPLRIYIYNGDVLLRFCPVKFRPFDPNNLDKYVVGDDYLPIWEVSKIQYWYKKLGYGMRDSLTAYLADDGRDASTIWRQIEEAIVIAIQSKQEKIVDIVKRFKSKRNFFELMRFDFLVDSKLNVYLLEANMSPNLSSAHYKPNQLLYEQVLFNLFGLVGLGDRVQKSLAYRNSDDNEMITSQKNVLTMPNICSSAICRNNCEEFDCKLCKYCLDQDADMSQDLYDAHKEHLNRGDCKRIFPPTMIPFKKLPENVRTLRKSDQLAYLWFQEKCNLDSTWC